MAQLLVAAHVACDCAGTKGIGIREEAIAKVERLLETKTEDQARQLFTLCSQAQWSYDRAKHELPKQDWKSQATPILYRPFDTRWTIWNSNVAVHRRERVMRHFMGPSANLGLVVNRQVNGAFSHALVTAQIINDCTLSNKTKERSYLLPLYLYPDNAKDFFHAPGDRIINLSNEFRLALKSAVAKEPAPEEAFAYIYAMLSAPSYRVVYEDQLGRNFPRVPLPRSASSFSTLAGLGKRLIALHLMESSLPPITSYPKPGSNRIDTVEFQASSNNIFGRVNINAEQYFDEMPTLVWHYKVGSYQVAAKWLRDRKGRLLRFDELQHYGRTISALAQTIILQDQIDQHLASSKR